MKLSTSLLWPMVCITTCLAAPSPNICTQLNRLLFDARSKQQAKAFCEIFIPPKTTTQTAYATMTSTIANGTPTVTAVEESFFTPVPITILSTRNLCEPTSQNVEIRSAAVDDILPRQAQPSVNVKILNTYRDTRPLAWRPLKAAVLINACSCLGVPATATITTTSTSTAFTAQAQVTETKTVTVTAPAETVTAIVKTIPWFRLVTSTSKILYIASGDFSWSFQPYDFAALNPPSGFIFYSIEPVTETLRSSSSESFWFDGDRYPRFGSHKTSCSLSSALELQCSYDGAQIYFYEYSYGRPGGTLMASTAPRADAVAVRAYPDCE